MPHVQYPTNHVTLLLGASAAGFECIELYNRILFLAYIVRCLLSCNSIICVDPAACRHPALKVGTWISIQVAPKRLTLISMNEKFNSLKFR